MSLTLARILLVLITGGRHVYREPAVTGVAKRDSTSILPASFHSTGERGCCGVIIHNYQGTEIIMAHRYQRLNTYNQFNPI